MHAHYRRCGATFDVDRVNGDRYEGEWRNGRMHGKGVKVMANGDVYNGTWENDKAEGNGVKVSQTRLCWLLFLDGAAAAAARCMEVRTCVLSTSHTTAAP